MGTVHASVLGQKCPYPELLLSEQKIVNFISWQIVYIIKAINNLKYEMTTWVICVGALIDKMFHDATGLQTLDNLVLIIWQSWFPNKGWPYSLFPTQCASCTIYNKLGAAWEVFPNPEWFSCCSGCDTVCFPDEKVTRITRIVTTFVTPPTEVICKVYLDRIRVCPSQ